MIRFNGRRIRPGDLGRVVMKAIEDEIPRIASNHLESIRCPVHGQSARARPYGKDRMTVSDFCCDQLLQEIERRLK